MDKDNKCVSTLLFSDLRERERKSSPLVHYQIKGKKNTCIISSFLLSFFIS
ncbi:hypothetical protein RchiOBHm_Chr2g0137601 [Rosa chinensis]|uniref:Uncharacterized protein n=1 Tax=Rosa chinensis TaxID=74649 RepID=A0A2P6RWN3_ROSCH|nr:hypothetical protein RchiOBHm_Chr2g0137601 [Rosa chinensis]